MIGGPKGCWSPVTPCGCNARGRGTIMCPLEMIREEMALSGGDGVVTLNVDVVVVLLGDLPYIWKGKGCFLAS